MKLFRRRGRMIILFSLSVLIAACADSSSSNGSDRDSMPVVTPPGDVDTTRVITPPPTGDSNVVRPDSTTEPR